jgi:hypothetical protein
MQVRFSFGFLVLDQGAGPIALQFAESFVQSRVKKEKGRFELASVK